VDAVPLLHDYLIDSAARLPDKIALVAAGVRTTYAALDAKSNALAHALIERGVARGDRVVIFADNTLETVIAFFAALKANAVASIVNPLTKVDKLVYLLNDCRAKALVSDAHLAAVFTPAVAKSAHLSTVIVSGAADAELLSKLPHGTAFDAALQQGSEAPPARRCIDIDLAAIIYTSGSTGDPKGVMLSHRNMLTASTSISTYLGNREDEIILCALPLSFDYGLYQVIMAFREGARVILERSFAFPAKVLSLVVEEQVTGLPGVPTMFALIAGMKSLASFDFSKVRYVTNTAAALSEKHILKLKELFPLAEIFSMYGLTECKRCTYLPPKDLERKPSSVGIAIPNTELWLVDEEDQKLGPGEVGQLVIRGATVMQGYWEKPGERVLDTGDYCRLDEEVYLYFVGRMDDIIKSRGEKVAPKEVEAALVSIEGVREAAVIGVPDDILGHAVKAFLVLYEGVSLTERDVIRACQGLLENCRVPKMVEFLPELPKTTTGKIKKTDLR
jgi:acyl-CoA synthetase (AMP-forming)/AMP-acid ligase II